MIEEEKEVEKIPSDEEILKEEVDELDPEDSEIPEESE